MIKQTVRPPDMCCPVILTLISELRFPRLAQLYVEHADVDFPGLRAFFEFCTQRDIALAAGIINCRSSVVPGVVMHSSTEMSCTEVVALLDKVEKSGNMLFSACGNMFGPYMVLDKRRIFTLRCGHFLHYACIRKLSRADIILQYAQNNHLPFEVDIDWLCLQE
jgi:hypothetical protein